MLITQNGNKKKKFFFFFLKKDFLIMNKKMEFFKSLFSQRDNTIVFIF